MSEGERGPEPDGENALAGPGTSVDPAPTSVDPAPEFPTHPPLADSSPPADGPELPPPAPRPVASATLSEQTPLRVAHRRARRAADLRQQLDEKAAATDELREALHELRQVLDVDAAPPAMNRRSRRAWVITGTAGGLAMATLVGWLLSDGSSSRIVISRPTAAPILSAPHATTSGASPAPPAGFTPPARPAVTRPATSVRPLRWPGGSVLIPPGLTATGPGASVPGTDVQVAVDPDGRHLDVFERLLLDTPSIDPLSLAAPTRPALDAEVRVSDLQVQLDDTAVPAVADGPGSWQAIPLDGSSYTRVTLRYRLAGAILAVTPAPPGRALGLVAPLTGLVSAVPGHAVQVRAGGDGVLGVSCPTAARGSVCGTRSGDGWTATVPEQARPIVVLLQLDSLH
jgi:hypothetical protein